MGRAPCCSKEGLKKGPWSTKEDLLLTNYIQQHGEGQWRSLPKKAGLLRCGKSCRLRWMNYLRPGIKRGNFSPEEEDLIVRLHSLLGNRWSLIAGRLPGRTDNEIKNYWNTHLLKKLKSSGIEPRPRKVVAKESKKKATKITPKSSSKKTGDNNNNNKKKQRKESHDNQAEKGYKVYAPKPIRLSSGVSRNNSVDDIAGSVTSSSGEVENKAADGSFIPWHLYELRDDFCGEVLTAGDLSPQCAEPGDDCLLDKVYDEYLQLLSENCFLEDDPFGANL